MLEIARYSNVERNLGRVGIEPTTLGLKVSRAVCLWEADSVETTRNLIETTMADASRNEFFEADAQHAGARGMPALGAVSA
jgi:hypothetical protein